MLPFSPKKSVGMGRTFQAEAKQVAAFTDDIECAEWLAEVGLPQYASTFKTNLSVGGDLLSRKRLSQIRLQDFSKMNITNYDHQKLLKDHIDHTLKFAFYSPVRRREVKKKFNIYIPNSESKPSKPKVPSASAMAKDLSTINIDASTNPRRADHTGKIAARRRRSFDHKAWDTIEKTRTADADNHNAVEFIRAGIADNSEAKEEAKKAQNRRRRWTFGDESTEELVLKMNRGTLYGNMALELDMLQKEMAILQEEHLNHFKNLINCERGSILFLNDVTKDLMLHTDNTWYRIPISSGIAGWCVSTGECLNIPDAYADYRFNK